MKELIDAGEIGEISMSESNFRTERGLELTPERWRSSRELNPTGVVIQLSIHHIDTFGYLHGPIKSVTAKLKRAYATEDVDDTSMMILEHENGALSYVGGGWAYFWAFHMNVHGTKGVAHFRITGQQWRDLSDPQTGSVLPGLFLHRRGPDGTMWYLYRLFNPSCGT